MAELGSQKLPFWGHYIGNPVVKSNSKLRENDARYGKKYGKITTYSAGVQGTRLSMSGSPIRHFLTTLLKIDRLETRLLIFIYKDRYLPQKKVFQPFFIFIFH